MKTVSKRARARTPSRDLEAALVDAAEVVLNRDGPAAVTVRAVATEAGVAPMGVYNRFGSKEGLMEAVLARGFEGLRVAVTGGDETDAFERLRASGVRYRQFALAHPQHYMAMFGEKLTGESSPELELCTKNAFLALVDHIEGVLETGLLRPGDPLDLAQQIWSAVHGAVTLEMQGRVLTPDPEASYLALLDLLVRGLMKTDGAAPGNGFQDPAPRRVL